MPPGRKGSPRMAKAARLFVDGGPTLDHYGALRAAGYSESDAADPKFRSRNRLQVYRVRQKLIKDAVAAEGGGGKMKAGDRIIQTDQHEAEASSKKRKAEAKASRKKRKKQKGISVCSYPRDDDDDIDRDDDDGDGDNTDSDEQPPAIHHPTIPSEALFFRTAPRSASDLAAAQVVIHKNARGVGIDRLMIEERATAALPRGQFRGRMSNDDDEIALRLAELRARLLKFDMLSPCFDRFCKIMIPGTATTAPIRDGEERDLLRTHEDLTLEDVKEWTASVTLYGTDDDVESLRWATALLENSCDAALRDRVGGMFERLDDKYKGGPTYFKIMMTEITATSNVAAGAQVDDCGESASKATTDATAGAQVDAGFYRCLPPGCGPAVGDTATGD